MRKSIGLLILIPGFLGAVSARQIIKRVDRNQLFRTQKFKVIMVIQKGERRLKKKFYGFVQKKGEKSFLEFTNPEDRGVKFLKLNKELWIYFPQADDIMKISGHMLRQGMMGSDISYEDMLETEKMERKYKSKRLADQKINGEKVFVIEARAKVASALYARQVLYIHKKKYVPIKIDLYASGGRLIKQLIMSDIVRSGRRYVPRKLVFKDLRRENSKTVLKFLQIQYNVRLPRRVFSRRYLKR